MSSLVGTFHLLAHCSIFVFQHPPNDKQFLGWSIGDAALSCCVDKVVAQE